MSDPLSLLGMELENGSAVVPLPLFLAIVFTIYGRQKRASYPLFFNPLRDEGSDFDLAALLYV